MTWFGLDFSDELALSEEQRKPIRTAVAQVSQVVRYDFCLSPLVVSVRLNSGPVVLRAGASRFLHGIPFSLVALLFGWWGFPWGPIWTVASVIKNCRGGEDITALATQPADGTWLPRCIGCNAPYRPSALVGPGPHACEQCGAGLAK